MKKALLSLLMVLSFISFPTISFAQKDAYKGELEYVRNDAIKENPNLKSQLSISKPRVFDVDLKDELGKVLVVEWNTKAAGFIYVFKLSREKFELIYKKQAYVVHAEAVWWGEHKGLLVSGGKFNDGIVDSSAHVLVYKKNKFINVMNFPYSKAASHFGFYLETQFVSSKNNHVRIIDYRNDQKAGYPASCTTMLAETYSWNEKTFSFDQVSESPISGKDLSELLNAGGLNILSEMEPFCSEETEPDFETGQVWEYKTRSGEDDSRLMIVKVDDDNKIENVVHVEVSNLNLKSGKDSSDLGDEIKHLAFKESVLKSEVVKCVGLTDVPPDVNDACELWEKDHKDVKASFFGSVASAIAGYEKEN